MQLQNSGAVRARGIEPNGNDMRGVVGIDRDCKVRTGALLTEGERGVCGFLNTHNNPRGKHSGWRASHLPISACSQSCEVIRSTVVGALDNDLRPEAQAIGCVFD